MPDRARDLRYAVQSCLARAFAAGLDTGLELGRLLGDAEPPALPDMGLLRKLATGGGRRTGDLLRRGWIRIDVTDAGRAALAGGEVDVRPKVETTLSGPGRE